MRARAESDRDQLLVTQPVLAAIKRCVGLGAVAHLVMVAVYLALAHAPMALLNVAGALAQWQSYRWLHRASSLGRGLSLAWIALLVFVTLGSLMVGSAAGLHLFLLPMVPLVVVARPMAGGRQNRLLALVLALLFLAVDALVPAQGILKMSLTPAGDAVTRAILMIQLVLVFFGLAFGYVQHIGKAQEGWRKLAHTDALTGLLNRRRFLDTAALAQARQRRYGAPVSFMLIDVDQFKTINDEFGHEQGDAVLQRIATVLTKHTRELDAVGRWGGGEFVVLLADTPMDGGQVVAGRILDAVRRPIVDENNGRSMRVTVTIGLTPYLSDETFETCLARANAALGEGKRAGRNRLVALAAAPAEDMAGPPGAFTA